MRATTARATTSTVLERAWCSPTHLAAKTETCQTFACGPTIRQNSRSSTACLPVRPKNSRRRSWKAHLALMKTQCPVNLPTWCPGASPICWIYRGQTMPWMPLVPPRWQRSWTPAVCSKPVKSTSCSQEHPTGPWILQPSQNSLLSGRFHRRTPLRLMPVRTALSWARELACWCSSVSAMQFEMRTKFSA